MSTTELLKKVAARRSVPPPALCLALRQAAGASRAELADALDVAETTVWRWETGRRKPSGRLLEQYIELLRELERVAQ